MCACSINWGVEECLCCIILGVWVYIRKCCGLWIFDGVGVGGSLWIFDGVGVGGGLWIFDGGGGWVVA